MRIISLVFASIFGFFTFIAIASDWYARGLWSTSDLIIAVMFPAYGIVLLFVSERREKVKTKLLFYLNILLLVLPLCVVFVAYMSLIIYADASLPKGTRYYLPEKYAGWVCVSFNVDSELPLPVEDGFLAAKIPANGILKTSSGSRFSPTRDEYYYYNDKGIREAKELQHGGGYTVQKGGEKSITFKFWISNGDLKSDYEKYVKNKDSADPRCGPWQQQ